MAYNITWNITYDVAYDIAYDITSDVICDIAYGMSYNITYDIVRYLYYIQYGTIHHPGGTARPVPGEPLCRFQGEPLGAVSIADILRSWIRTA